MGSIFSYKIYAEYSAVQNLVKTGSVILSIFQHEMVLIFSINHAQNLDARFGCRFYPIFIVEEFAKSRLEYYRNLWSRFFPVKSTRVKSIFTSSDISLTSTQNNAIKPVVDNFAETGAIFGCTFRVQVLS